MSVGVLFPVREQAYHGAGLVVCTQPYSVGAVYTARLVAEEYDGAPVGHSVGYDTGQGRPVRGQAIMVATNDAVVRWALRGPSLPGVAVLMIEVSQALRCGSAWVRARRGKGTRCHLKFVLTTHVLAFPLPFPSPHPRSPP